MIYFPEELGYFDLSNYTENKGVSFDFFQEEGNLLINKRRNQAKKNQYRVSLSLLKEEYSIFQNFYYLDLKMGSKPFIVPLKKSEESELIEFVVKIVSPLSTSFSTNKVILSFELYTVYDYSQANINFILKTGSWNDENFWIDTEEWQD